MTESVAMLTLLDGLAERRLLERAQIVQLGSVSIQLGPPLFKVADDTDPDEQRADPGISDPNALLFGASEGS